MYIGTEQGRRAQVREGCPTNIPFYSLPKREICSIGLAMTDYNTFVGQFCDSLEVSAAQASSEDTCPICLHAYTPQTPVVKTHCQHIFHHACLYGWLSNGNPTCPMCREVFYPLPTTPIPVPHGGIVVNNNQAFEDIESLLLWGASTYEHLYESAPDVPHGDWFEENRVLRMLEHTNRIQRQRLAIMEDLSNIAQEDEELTHAEIQYYRRIEWGETEEPDRYRRTRVESLRMIQEQQLPNFWDLDASLQELIVEERQLRRAEEVLETPLQD
jgi:hypothetical protein